MTAEAWAMGEVKNKLVVAGEQGEMLSFDALRSEVGIGHEDLTDVLDALREAGDAVEGAPGEWRAPYEDEREARSAGAPASEADEDADDAEPPPARRARRRPHDSDVVMNGEPGGVVLTMAVASALDAETIGKLVEAGIAEAKQNGQPFILRVEPSQDAAD